MRGGLQNLPPACKPHFMKSILRNVLAAAAALLVCSCATRKPAPVTTTRDVEQFPPSAPVEVVHTY